MFVRVSVIEVGFPRHPQHHWNALQVKVLTFRLNFSHCANHEFQLTEIAIQGERNHHIERLEVFKIHLVQELVVNLLYCQQELAVRNNVFDGLTV